MRIRDKQAMLRLQKISQASSPSPSRQTRPQQPTRINPLTLTTISSHRPVVNTKQSRQIDIEKMQQQIMDRRSRLIKIQDAWNNRSQCNTNPSQSIELLLKMLIKCGKQDLRFKWGLMKALIEGKKSVINWLLLWLQKVFWFISLLLMNRRIKID